MIYAGIVLTVLGIIFCIISWVLIAKSRKDIPYAGRIYVVKDNDNEDYIFFEIENLAAFVNDNEVVVKVIRKENTSSNGK